METIYKKDLMPLLQRSGFVNQFENEVTIPKKYVITEFKTVVQYKFIIKNDYDFNKLMDKLRFHMVKELPYEIYDYIKEHKPDLSDFKDFFFDELSSLKEMKKKKLVQNTATKGYLNLMKYLHDKKYNFDANVASTVARNGHLECLKFLRKCNKKWLKGISCSTTRNCTQGSLDCLKYLHECGYKLNADICFIAACNGNFECLKYAHENGCPMPDTVLPMASNHGNLECLKYAHENGCPWLHMFVGPAGHGHLECLKYEHENGCPWDIDTCKNAANYGNLECLKYAHENGCPWDVETCSYAAKHGKLECLKYAHENGCPWNEDTCEQAAKYGHLECLKYAHGNGCKWDEDTCEHAAEHDMIECLKYAHGNGCPWDENTCAFAVKNDAFECLEYAINNHCPYDKSYLIEIAKFEGSDDVFAYLNTL